MRFSGYYSQLKFQKLNKSSHEVQISHLHAKGLFWGSKLEGIRFPFCRKISFILAGSSWMSRINVFGSVFLTSSRSRRMTPSMCVGRGFRYTLWEYIPHNRSILQKPSHFTPKKRWYLSWYRQRMGVCAGKFSSINSWLASVLCGCAKSCSKIMSEFLLRSLRSFNYIPFDFLLCSKSSSTAFRKTSSWYTPWDELFNFWRSL